MVWYPVLLQESSSGKSPIPRNTSSALGHLAAQTVTYGLSPLPIPPRQNWGGSLCSGPSHGPAAPLCPWQEKGLGKAERRKGDSPKVSGPPPEMWGEHRGAAAALVPPRTAPVRPSPLPTLRHFPVVAPPLLTHSQLSLQPLPASPSLNSWRTAGGRAGGLRLLPSLGMLLLPSPRPQSPGSCSRSPVPSPALRGGAAVRPQSPQG